MTYRAYYRLKISSQSKNSADKINTEAEKVGRVIADMTFLKTEEHIQLRYPKDFNGCGFYKVEFDLVMIVEGRNLKYEARWPQQKSIKRNAALGRPQVWGSGQLNITAAFVPGTN